MYIQCVLTNFKQMRKKCILHFTIFPDKKFTTENRKDIIKHQICKIIPINTLTFVFNYVFNKADRNHLKSAMI